MRSVTPLSESTIQRQVMKALEKEGWTCVKLIQTNLNGMPDLLCMRHGMTMFVEVKSESGGTGILPKDRVDARKQRKLLRLAQFYMKEKRLQGVSARFDVVQVRFTESGGPQVEIIPNAFDAPEI